MLGVTSSAADHRVAAESPPKDVHSTIGFSTGGGGGAHPHAPDTASKRPSLRLTMGERYASRPIVSQPWRIPILQDCTVCRASTLLSASSSHANSGDGENSGTRGTSLT